ncbi:MAG: hypothetical protein IPM37_03180 [Hahellaceae bacterium]|nr:hypothetical protein [Hahellaceae bacterium]
MSFCLVHIFGRSISSRNSISFLLAYHFFGYLVAYEGPAKLPEELETNEKAYIEFGAILPELLIFAMMKSWQWLLVWMLPAAFTTYLILNYLKRPERFRFDTLLLSLCAISALFNLIAFSIICLATAIVMRPTEENTFQAYARKTQLYPLFALISVCSIVWVSYGLLNSDWLGEISNLDYDKYPNRVTQLGSLLINYPETVSRFLIPWFNAMPLNSLLLFVGLGAAILLNICQPERSNAHFRIIFALLVASLLFVSLVDTIQKTTRYSFFIYPLLIIFLSVSLSQLDRFFPRHLNETSSIALLASAFVFMVLSDDFSLKHMANINSPEYVYRTAYPLKQGNHYYPRRDFESPGTYVNEHLQPGEIVISEVTPTDLYLKKRMDYIYMPMEEHQFLATRCFWRNLGPMDECQLDLPPG